ncbi:MAG: putative Ig domain-containing protein [Bacteroidaceae bacterium]|nr:putative Ig domain-containing protein [Bacteroidaceae bacterium]
MKKKLFLLLTVAAMTLDVSAQPINVSKARFQKGDDMNWAKPETNDASWRELDMTKTWDDQGLSINNGYGWYRVHITIPKSLLQGKDQNRIVVFDLPKADDTDECYLNGKLIGKTGRMPGDKGGYGSAWSSVRSYSVDVKTGGIKWDADNVVAIRVYNGGEPGGLFDRPLSIRVPNAAEGLSMHLSDNNDKGNCAVELRNAFPLAVSGTLDVKVIDRESGQEVSKASKKLSPKQGKPAIVTVPYDKSKVCVLNATFKEAKTGKVITRRLPLKYILTPAAPATPRFNGAPLFGVRPSSPVIYRFPVSGERPMKFTATNLPAGVQLSEADGVLSGKVAKQGDYTFTVTAENAKGKASQQFTLKVGDRMIALTPPMGWNSWNCWALSVSQEKVMSSAQALLDKGLADYGYCYMNIDDGWEAPERNPDGTIAVNEKFPSMKALGDWLHERGLKFGIYSSPGDYTCGGYLGSIDHEQQDAESYNSWGIDYLKYDWCGYGREHAKERDKGVASYVRPYLLMQKFLREQPRDIFYSLCQYGMAKVWEWGLFVDANSWRTTGDINDSWGSMFDIGFKRQAGLAPYAGPGHWNDPDMLILGKVGWSSNLRDSRLTPDEQYTHITLWTLLASNMLIGCDIAQMDDFTIGLLCNHEVNLINQDILGRQADRAVKDGDIEIWERPLADGSHAIGVFNVGAEDKDVDLAKYFGKLGIKSLQSMRDLWRQKDLATTDTRWTVPTHGCKYIKVKY